MLVLNAVFLPVAFLGGLVGEMYRQFAITIAVSVTISGFVALTLTPAMCARLLKTRRGRAERVARALRCGLPRLTRRLHERRALDDAPRRRRGRRASWRWSSRSGGSSARRRARSRRTRTKATCSCSPGCRRRPRCSAPRPRSISSTKRRSRTRRSSTTSRSRASTCRRAASAATRA